MKIFLSILVFFSFFLSVQALSVENFLDESLNGLNNTVSSNTETETSSGKNLQDEVLKKYAERKSYIDTNTLKLIG